ncbi:MAG: hypothetical protein SFU85_04240 [Candidatus Methylacidiphilales bacterium]|nr:hypothetical protein [Candidatus Methylacidiphilales bacterium]
MQHKTVNQVCTLIVACLLSMTTFASAQNTIVTVTENPSATSTSLIGTNIFTFNNLPIGLNYNVSWDGVGKFDQLNVIKANQYGGAPDAANPGGSPYAVQGIGSIKTTTFTLNVPNSYFGLWWSAGDASNQLSFYKNNTLVAQYTTASLLSGLDRSYFGNPLNRKLNSGEAYAFINFYGDASTSWDQIVLSNVTSSGFESDNFTTRQFSFNPKVDAPESLGKIVASIQKGTTTKVSNVPTTWVWTDKTSVPAAPVPPQAALGLFALAFALRGRLYRTA